VTATLRPYTIPLQPPIQDDCTGNKRRRIDHVAAAHLYPTIPGSYQHQLPYSLPQHHVPVSLYAEGVAGHYVARQSQNSPLTTPYLGTLDAQQGRWAHSFSHAPQCHISTYQGPWSMQHAYYYGQSDLSVDKSPRLPAWWDGQSSIHTPSILPTNQAQVMTYMRRMHHSPGESQQSYITRFASSYTTTLHNLDAGSFSLGHDMHSHQQHQQHRVKKHSSNMYYEDVGMPLKIQSIPVLDSLVSVTRALLLQHVASRLVRTSLRRAENQVVN
jgi:hypothetical protein